MYKYKLLKKDAIYNLFADKFINISGYDSFAKSNEGCKVHMFDFINNSRIVLFQTIMEYIDLINNEEFYILWNISQYYIRNRLKRNCMYAKIKKDELMRMLIEQQEDMIDNRLCFYQNKERADYWDVLIFDESLKWCAAITHEDNTDGNRLCFLSEAK